MPRYYLLINFSVVMTASPGRLSELSLRAQVSKLDN